MCSVKADIFFSFQTFGQKSNLTWIYLCVFFSLASLAAVLEVQRDRAAGEGDGQEPVKTHLPVL